MSSQQHPKADAARLGPVEITTESREEDGRYRGLAIQDTGDGHGSRPIYTGDSWFGQEDDALQQAENWCRDRGISCQRQ